MKSTKEQIESIVKNSQEDDNPFYSNELGNIVNHNQPQVSQNQNDENRIALKNEILRIRNSGKTNMFDLRNVYSLANDQLKSYLLKKPSNYIKFILYGKNEDYPEE